MSMNRSSPPEVSGSDAALSLYQLLDPQVLAHPYPLYQRLRSEDPVHWDPFLHAWVVTRYADVVTVLSRCSANRTPTPEQLTALGLEALAPLARDDVVEQAARPRRVVHAEDIGVGRGLLSQALKQISASFEAEQRVGIAYLKGRCQRREREFCRVHRRIDPERRDWGVRENRPSANISRLAIASPSERPMPCPVIASRYRHVAPAPASSSTLTMARSDSRRGLVPRDQAMMLRRPSAPSGRHRRTQNAASARGRECRAWGKPCA